MTPKEQRELALNCGMSVSQGGNGYWDHEDQLDLYTTAVEAKERKSIADWLYKVGTVDSEDVRLITTGEYLR